MKFSERTLKMFYEHQESKSFVFFVLEIEKNITYVDTGSMRKKQTVAVL